MKKPKKPRSDPHKAAQTSDDGLRVERAPSLPARKAASLPAPPPKMPARPPVTRPTPRAAAPKAAELPFSTRLRAAWYRFATSRSDQADAMMLALPVALVGLTIGVANWAQGPAETERSFTAALTQGSKRALVGLPRTASPVSLAAGRAEAVTSAPLAPTAEMPGRPLAAATVAGAAPDGAPTAATAPPAASLTESASSGPPIAPPSGPAPAAVLPSPAPLELVMLPGGAPASARMPDVALARDAAPRPQAAINLSLAITLPAVMPPDEGLAALDATEMQCRFQPDAPRLVAERRDWGPGDAETFGLALAAAARRQLDDFIIYNDRYTRLKYPMGDVHPMYGVCTDVIVRAYRSLGLDLQELVQRTKSGSGDPNIDHRRVDTLRKFFTRFGESLPISTFAEDYRPGDIVTYWRPQNRHSRTHIAIVSDANGPSGRPLIIHNRGWGPQHEDALFVDQITGHYRFMGLKPAPETGLLQRAKTPRDLPRSGAVANKRVIRTGLQTPLPAEAEAPRLPR